MDYGGIVLFLLVIAIIGIIGFTLVFAGVRQIIKEGRDERSYGLPATGRGWGRLAIGLTLLAPATYYGLIFVANSVSIGIGFVIFCVVVSGCIWFACVVRWIWALVLRKSAKKHSR